jgi:NADH dehydrogenase
MKTLVVGATGLLGHEICRRLTDAGRPVRALVRRTSDQGKRAELERLGVALVEGDLKDKASLARACTGVQSVISTASSTFSRQPGDSIESVDQKGQLALIDAAGKAGVEHVVFISFRENPTIQYPLTAAKREVEHALKASGMNYTILQASYFMEIWLTPALGFDVANGKVRLYGDGSHAISWISYRDVARAAAAVVTEPTARNMVVELGGPQALTPREVVRMFEAAGAGEIATESVSESALESQMNAATDPLQKSFAGLMLQCASGDAIDVTTSHRLFPFQMTSVRDYITAQLTRA